MFKLGRFRAVDMCPQPCVRSRFVSRRFEEFWTDSLPRVRKTRVPLMLLGLASVGQKPKLGMLMASIVRSGSYFAWPTSHSSVE